MYHVAEVQGWTKTKEGDISIHKAIFWSSVSGVMSGIAANPASVVKTRMQAAAHPSIAVGRQYVYSGNFFTLSLNISLPNSLLSILRKYK